MKAFDWLFSLITVTAAIIAITNGLKGRGIQDSFRSNPNAVETPGKKALRIGAAIWLVLFGVVMLLLAGAFVLPAIFKLFV